MSNVSSSSNQIKSVSSFQDLTATPFQGVMNALSWTRSLKGDFHEIVRKIELDENITIVDESLLLKMNLSEQGNQAREIIINDLKGLRDLGASPTLNLIKCYERDDIFPILPTDVYSFHVDRSPIPTDTYLCTYFGESSEILPNTQARQKVLIPEIRKELEKLYTNEEESFESFLKEHFFDLHYEAMPNAKTTSLGVGNLWKLAVDYPESQSLPCVHRAPKEKEGQFRLLLIC